MLEERVAFPQRVGSARSGCGSSRVVSARAAGGRIGSARPSSDTHRPKLHTGRPSSAPPGHTATPAHAPSWPAARLAGHTHAPHRTADVSHLNLRVEGKSFLSLHKAGSYERHKEAVAAAAAAAAHSKGAARAAAAAGFGSTYTVVCLDPEEGQEGVAGPGRFGDTFSKDGPGDGFGATYTLRSSLGGARHSPSSSDSEPRLLAGGDGDYEGCPSAPGEGGGYWGVGGSLLRPPATDTTSNEDSEGTVMSLGRRIQLMAATGPPGSRHHHHHHQQHQQPLWDTEWRTLLQQNHHLLLQLSSREDLRPGQDLRPGEDLRAGEDQADTLRSASLQDSAVQTLPATPPPQPPGPPGYEAGQEPPPLEEAASLGSLSPECVLEDIAEEEASLSDTASPRPTLGRTHLGGRDTPTSPLSSASPRTHQPRAASPHRQDTHTHSPSRQPLPEGPTQAMNKAAAAGDSLQGPLQASFTLQDMNKQAGTPPPPPLTDYASRWTDQPQPLKTEDYTSRWTDHSHAPAEMEDHSRGSPTLTGETQKTPNLCEPAPEYLSRPPQAAEDPLKDTATAPEQDGWAADDPLKDTATSAATAKQDSPPHPPQPQVTPAYTDSSCTADLPSYRAGAVTTFIMRSRFAARDKTVPLLRAQPSKDLLEALRMIEDEEKSAKSAEDLPERDTGTSTAPRGLSSPTVPPRGSGGEREGGASLPVVEVLVEKVFLFTQDLVERWHLVEQHDRRDELLRQLMEAERQLEGICVSEGCKQDPATSPHLHQACEGRLRRLRAETDARIQKNLDLIRKLMDDKKRLTEECERQEHRAKLSANRQADRTTASEERHTQELKTLKERLAASEQDRRERWTAQKTRSIRESVHRGLDTKLKEMSAKHRDELSLMKAQHWEALREAEEKGRANLQAAEEEWKRKAETEKEEACRRERDREQQRLDMELRQSEQLSLARLEGVRRQQEKDLRALIEEHQAAMDKLRVEAEAGLREAQRERDRVKEECQDRIRTLTRKHEEELSSLQQREERNRSEWKEQWMREQAEARMQAERELRRRLKSRETRIRQAIREIQAETQAREGEQRMAYDVKIKNMRERYEREMSEMDCGERAARTRYLEMKALLTQKEEEIVYLRARLHTQDLELCDLQQMLQPPDG
ncbi:centrosomal protein of 131 kDa-like isoform X2 [Eriocheir sinensis]|uniref:centrosomal protein of 131 kDa-like isoform X2 n=1 Tax=Eriocheir sinensis TaxID=95602 RepID=UPI0021C823B5|nr:centrosomal protein of 131 kDa-like isoform X2 [Eriocheir sinensis]